MQTYLFHLSHLYQETECLKVKKILRPVNQQHGQVIDRFDNPNISMHANSITKPLILSSDVASVLNETVKKTSNICSLIKHPKPCSGLYSASFGGTK